MVELKFFHKVLIFIAVVYAIIKLSYGKNVISTKQSTVPPNSYYIPPVTPIVNRTPVYCPPSMGVIYQQTPRPIPSRLIEAPMVMSAPISVPDRKEIFYIRDLG